MTTSLSSRSDPIIPHLPPHTISENSNSHRNPNTAIPQNQNPWNKSNPRTKERKIKFEDIIYDPTLTGADDFVMKNDIWTKGEVHWKHCIVGFVPGWQPTLKSIEKFAISKWGSYGLHSITQLRKGVFLFRFSDDEQVETVLEKKTWTYYERPFILQKWSEAADVDPLNLTSVPVWVTFPNPRLNLWSAEALGLMASTLGKPVAFDFSTTNIGTTEFAKVCVILNAAHRRKDVVRFTTEEGERVEQWVGYEWFPDHCKNCQVFGHTMEVCPKTPPPPTVYAASPAVHPSSPPTVQPSSPPRSIQQRVSAPPTPNVQKTAKSYHSKPPLINRSYITATPPSSSLPAPLSSPIEPVVLINPPPPSTSRDPEIPPSPNRFLILQNDDPERSEFPPIPPPKSKQSIPSTQVINPAPPNTSDTVSENHMNSQKRPIRSSRSKTPTRFSP